jgi:hypothetical protein
MFFVFGTTDKDRKRGFVVDRCPSCLDLEWFELVDHHRAWHLYFVPLGRGRFLYTSVRCNQCGAKFPLEGEGFARVIRESERGDFDVMAGLRHTNPELARRFTEIEELARSAKPPYRDPTDEGSAALLAESVERLLALERRGGDTARYLGRFASWSRLSVGERELLAAELKGFHDATAG